jgi:hypothetical protein
MRNSAEKSMQLWAVDVSANQSRPLTNPDLTQFSICNGDWDVFLSAALTKISGS